MVTPFVPHNRGADADLPDVTVDLASKICEILGSPNAVSELERIHRRSPGRAEKLDPAAFDNADRFRDSYLVAELLGKYRGDKFGGVTPAERAIKALEKFREAEQLCFETNLRLSCDVPSGMRAIISIARKKISQALGCFDWNAVEHHAKHGPGATTSSGRAQGDAAYKFENELDASPLALPLVAAFLDANPGYAYERNVRLWLRGRNPEVLSVVNSAKVTTVPKNSEIDRCIGIEPGWNMFFQRGIGICIRNSLRRVGIDLRDQTMNQSLAKYGSSTGRVATLDLRMASDLVSRGLVYMLLPADWISALEQLRTPSVVLPCGEVVHLHKFSAMGNGYTFELESLIFWAILSACYNLLGLDDTLLSVYGDDLIVKTEAVGTVRAALSYFGFELNEEKSFSSGPFRESCGEHYFMGERVTPFYIREDVDSVSRYYWFLNSISKWGNGQYRDERFRAIHSELVEYLREKRLCNFVPFGFGDVGIESSFDEAVPRVLKEQAQLWQTPCFSVKQLVERRGAVINMAGCVWASLRNLSRRGASHEDDSATSIAPRDRGVKRWSKTIVSQWSDHRPWYDFYTG